MNKQQELKLKRQLMALSKASRFTEAENLARHMLSQLSGDMELWYAYAQIEMALGKSHDSALAYLKAAEKPSPLRAQALKMATDMCQEAGLHELGLQAAQHILAVVDQSAESYFKAGFFAWHCQKDEEAVRCLEKAVQMDTGNAGFWEQLAQVYVHLGEIEKALEALEKAASIEPSTLSPRIQGLYISNYLSTYSEQALFDAHLKFGKLLEDLYPETRFPDPDPSARRIRVAYLSRDFRSHAVASFFIALLAAHDREQVEVFCYSDVVNPDAMTEKLKGLAEHWLSVVHMNDYQLSEKIRKDGVDVLVDLSAYAGGNRAPVFAMRSAPVQVNYLGYPNTTGLKNMDYRITDAICDPAGEKGRFYTETLIRLESGFLSYQCLDAEVPETEPPCASNAFLTFGSFNVYPKIQAPMRNAWAEILRRAPNAKLFIKAKPFSEPAWRDSVTRFFVEKGAQPEQLLFAGRSGPYREHLESYAHIDIHLDTHPYNGTTTTCDALWMGVPTLCVLGDSHRSRVSASIMQRAGLSEMVAHSMEDYVDKALEFARKPEQFVALRRGNRERMLNSALTSGRAIARELESFYAQALADLRAAKEHRTD